MSPSSPARVKVVPVFVAYLPARLAAAVLAVLEVARVEVGADDALVQLCAADVAERGEGGRVVEESEEGGECWGCEGGELVVMVVVDGD